jgi:hypothetical protein
MLKDWKTELAKEIKFAKEMEQEAQEAVAKSRLPASKLADARKMFENGQENLKFVLYGNGVHNKKYSMLLLDAAIVKFEDLIDYLEGN